MDKRFRENNTNILKSWKECNLNLLGKNGEGEVRFKSLRNNQKGNGSRYLVSNYLCIIIPPSLWQSSCISLCRLCLMFKSSLIVLCVAQLNKVSYNRGRGATCPWPVTALSQVAMLENKRVLARPGP
jgi:hypothetical protein